MAIIETWFTTNNYTTSLALSDIITPYTIKAGETVDLLTIGDNTAESISNSPIIRNYSNKIIIRGTNVGKTYLSGQHIHTHTGLNVLTGGDTSDADDLHTHDNLTTEDEVNSLIDTNGFAKKSESVNQFSDLNSDGEAIDEAVAFAHSDHIHNNLSGLNEGDFKHLTSAEYENFSTLTDGSDADGLHTHSSLGGVHNDLEGIQGGATSEYYHLTKEENSLVSRLGEDSAGLTFDDSLIGIDSLWSRIDNILIPLNRGDSVWLDSYSSKLFFGKHQEASIYYDGQDLIIGFENPSFGDEEIVRINDDLAVAGLTSTNRLLITEPTPNGWLFRNTTDPAALGLQSQNTGDVRFQIYTKAGDGNDACLLDIYGIGTPNDATGTERMTMGWSAVLPGWFILTGGAHDLWTGTLGNLGQLKLIQSDGSVTIANDLIVNASHTPVDGLHLYGSGIAATSRGGHIYWYLDSFESSNGVLFMTPSNQLVFDTTFQSSDSDVGNAWISFSTGTIHTDGEMEGSRMIIAAGTNQALNAGTTYMRGFNGMIMTDTRGWCMPRSGSIVGLGTTLNLDGLGGTWTTEIRINTNTAGLTNTGTNLASGDAKDFDTQARGIDTFSAGDVISFRGVVVTGGTGAWQVICDIQFDT